MKKFILIIFLILNSLLSFSQIKQVWMVGPMFHLNIGDSKLRGSFGIEAAYWNYEHFPYSYDFAIEFEKQKIRFYSEVQTGIGIAGISLGPVLEIRTNEAKLKAGFQTSVWGNYFLGFDLRYRNVGGDSYFCPGTYFKIPLGYGNSNNNNNENHSDWDFDWD